MSYDLVTILGPTAVGKTKLAVFLANIFNGEIISADSRQVYKKLNIGSGKDLNDYKIGNTKIKYHLIDIIDPHEEFNLYLFQEHFYKAYKVIKSKNKLPFLVGGTGLYLSSILQDYHLSKTSFHHAEIERLNKIEHEELKKILIKLNSNLHNSTDLLDKKRTIKAILIEKSKLKQSIKSIPFNSFNIGIKIEKAQLKKNIEARLRKRLEEGMIQEVENLLNEGIPFERLLSLGLEYKFITLYLQKELSYNDMFQKLNSGINNFAKRQMTWYRKMEREGIKINWINGPDFENAKKLIEDNMYES